VIHRQTLYLCRVAIPGVASVFVTYPLELIRVRLAFQTKQGERSTFRQIIKTIAGEGFVQPAIESVRHNTASVSGIVLAPTKPVRTVYQAIHPFYRGFSVTLLGMIPYAGVSFLTYGTLKRHLPDHFPVMKKYKTISDLSCGAVAGAVSQTASYPFEVIRRRMQVGGIKAPGLGGHEVGWRDAVRSIWKDGKGRIGRGFYVGLSIGYIKVIPMTRCVFGWRPVKQVFPLRPVLMSRSRRSLSFATWQFMKRRLEI
jgi:solute carrier family 25 protein 16